MDYQIRLGEPEFKRFHDDLVTRAGSGKLDRSEVRLFKKLTKAIGLLSSNPKHNSLNSHEIEALSERYTKMTGLKVRVWQSYLENNTPAAGRLYWVYGPGRQEITLIGLEPHPEDRKRAGYAAVDLSNLPAF